MHRIKKQGIRTEEMTTLHAESYSLTNDIAVVYDKANALVYELLQLKGCSDIALTYAAIIDEYKEQIKGRMMRKSNTFENNARYNLDNL